MTRYLIISLFAIPALFADGATLRFTGASREPVAIDVTASTGLDALYVLDGVDGVTATVDGVPSGQSPVWKKWGYMGAAYAEDVDPSLVSTSGSSTSLSTLDPDTGYAVEFNGDTYYFWIADYSRHPFDAVALTPDAEQDCATTNLRFDGSAQRMTYYTINARSQEIDREITLTYRTLVRDEQEVAFIQSETTESFASLGDVIHVNAPLCDTDFHLEGDRFLRAWGIAESCTSPVVSATAVDVITTATQTVRDSENEIKNEGSTLGGSAPAEIIFRGAVTDAAVYREWQMARDSEFYEIVYRNQDLDFTYTFNEMGTSYVRLLAANASGDCEAQNDPYVVTIGESALKCPNAFSPGASEGVNDEWRVSYKSIVSFECYIFDRWGTKMFEFNDPATGWDGKYRGKLVPAGVYYYVIRARGSDGKDYNLSGDINILKIKSK